MQIGRSFWTGAVVTIVIVAVWTFPANRRPDLTYHFAPLLAGAAWPVLSRGEHRRPLSVSLVAAVGAAAIASMSSIVLYATGRLNGPTFWNEGPALVEAILFSVIAATWGLRVATRSEPGLLGRRTT